MSATNEWAREQLFLMKEEKYGEFSQKLTPNVTKFLGVRIGKIRMLAKEIANDDWQDFLQAPFDTYQEEKILHGMVIGLAKMSVAERRHYLERFVPLIDSWLVCDTVCSAFKFIKKDRDWVWGKIQQYLKSDKEYEIRFALVTLLNYFIDEDYIEAVLCLSNEVKKEAYYVQMANAWLISMCYVKFKEKTESFLKNNQLDSFTQNKAIQKIRESYRVEKEDKERILALKK